MFLGHECTGEMDHTTEFTNVHGNQKNNCKNRNCDDG
jgi:hypothetical protein